MAKLSQDEYDKLLEEVCRDKKAYMNYSRHTMELSDYTCRMKMEGKVEELKEQRSGLSIEEIEVLRRKMALGILSQDEYDKLADEVFSDKEAYMNNASRMMALSDYNSGVANSRKEGIVEVAKKMKALNTPLSFIHETTSLSIEEIERL
jgi:hypothetical protein